VSIYPSFVYSGHRNFPYAEEEDGTPYGTCFI
jgi:hypothetical protein